MICIDEKRRAGGNYVFCAINNLALAQSHYQKETILND